MSHQSLLPCQPTMERNNQKHSLFHRGKIERNTRSIEKEMVVCTDHCTDSTKSIVKIL